MTYFYVFVVENIFSPSVIAIFCAAAYRDAEVESPASPARSAVLFLRCAAFLWNRNKNFQCGVLRTFSCACCAAPNLYETESAHFPARAALREHVYETEILIFLRAARKFLRAARLWNRPLGIILSTHLEEGGDLFLQSHSHSNKISREHLW